MKLGVVISMYDEHDVVKNSINEIKSKYKDAVISLVHSDDGVELNFKNLVKSYEKLSDLSKLYNRFECPSQAVCRNFGVGFTNLYKTNDYDLITAFTGDTSITDASNFTRMYDQMKSINKVAMVSQSIGHNFHAADDDPPNNVVEGRPQSENIHDFACTLFFIRSTLIQTKPFSNIEVTNRWTSEQCFGDELSKHVDYSLVGRLNANNPRYTYYYRDGISYHATHGGKPGR